MAILAIFTGKGFTKQMYDSLRKDLQWEAHPAPGAMLHACAFDDKGDLHVADLWESPEQMNEFATARLFPAMQKLGIPAPAVEVFPVHNVNAFAGVERYRTR